MTTANSIHTHVSKDGELAMQCVLVESSTEASKIVVLADTIQFQVLTIEEETLLGIKLHITESCGGSLCIHYLAAYQ